MFICEVERLHDACYIFVFQTSFKRVDKYKNAYFLKCSSWETVKRWLFRVAQCLACFIIVCVTTGQSGALFVKLTSLQ